jgi:hypothetical protein
MIDVAGQWNPKQELLKSIIYKPERFAESIELCLGMHLFVHASEMSGVNFMTFEDELWNGLDDTTFRAMPSEKDNTIAWNLWHLSRIEDLTSNLLIAGEYQVIYADKWCEKMNVDIIDTGNAMTTNEIINFSKKIKMESLRNYRIAVGRKTREIIKGLSQKDIKTKVSPKGLKRILDEGGVVEGSKGLLDFWGRKDIAGILLMPLTRHQVVHLNNSLRIKAKLCKKS